ncbi:MAG: hypothetical protein R2765_05975 [Ferruginibacter sp.]
MSLTSTLEIVAPEGIPDTGMVEAPAPAGGLGNEPSGIATLIVPELKDTFEVDDDELVSITALSPKHMVTEAGVTVGAGGV